MPSNIDDLGLVIEPRPAHLAYLNIFAVYWAQQHYASLDTNLLSWVLISMQLGFYTEICHWFLPSLYKMIVWYAAKLKYLWLHFNGIEQLMCFSSIPYLSYSEDLLGISIRNSRESMFHGYDRKVMSLIIMLSLK